LATLGLFTITAIVIITGNALTIIAVVRTKKLRRASTNTFVVNLAIADEMVGWLLAFVLISPFFLKSEQVLRASVCLIRAPYYTTVAVSTCTLLAIAVDRYIAVIQPLSYKKHMTIKRARVISGIIWLCQFIIIGGTTCYYGSVSPIARIASGALRDLIEDKIVIWVILPQIYLPVIGNIILYGSIFISISKRKRVSVSISGQDGDTNRGPSKSEKMTTAVTKMMCMVLGYLILAWLPFFSIIFIYSQGDVIPFWFGYVRDATVFLVYSNSAINPIIYSWYNRDFKQAYRQLLKCKKIRNNLDDSSAITQSTTAP
jgi:hypothetical protein